MDKAQNYVEKFRIFTYIFKEVCMNPMFNFLYDPNRKKNEEKFKPLELELEIEEVPVELPKEEVKKEERHIVIELF